MSWSDWPTPSPPGCAQHGLGARTFTLKVRDGGFTTITRADDAWPAPSTLPGHRRGHASRCSTPSTWPRGVRLLGLAASEFAAPAEQLSFDLLAGSTAATADGRWSAASRAVDGVRERFGDDGDRSGQQRR